MEEQIKTGLWKKISQAGNEYYSGKINIDDKTYKVVLFINNKLSDKSPDFNITLSEIKDNLPF